MIKDYISLMRPQQWYKNLVLFLAIIFSGNLLDKSMLFYSSCAFAVFCLISSSGYLINDIIDRKNDKLDPKKKNRPIASGKIMPHQALVLSFILLVISLFLSFSVSKGLFLATAAYFLLSLLYSLVLKNIPVMDVSVISINFVIRAVAGALAISVWISPWLVLCPFFLAMLLGFAKRNSELRTLKGKASSHRISLRYYTEKSTLAGMHISSALVILSYISFSLFSIQKKEIVFTSVFVILGVWEYLRSAKKDSSIGAYPLGIFRNSLFVVNTALYLLAMGWVVYF